MILSKLHNAFTFLLLSKLGYGIKHQLAFCLKFQITKRILVLDQTKIRQTRSITRHKVCFSAIDIFLRNLLIYFQIVYKLTADLTLLKQMLHCVCFLWWKMGVWMIFSQNFYKSFHIFIWSKFYILNIIFYKIKLKKV